MVHFYGILRHTYRCVDFENGDAFLTIFRFMCGSLTVFDESHSVCVHPGQEQPPCSLGTEVDSADTTLAPFTQPTTTASIESSTMTSENPTETPVESSAPVESTTPVETTTPIESTTPIKLTTPTPSPAVIITDPPRPVPPTSLPFTIDCSAGIHRYPYDCNRFYQCFGDGDERQVYVFSCAPGLIFDEVLTRCTKPTEFTCEATTSDSTELFGGNFQLSCGTDALHRYPLSCNNFYQCFKNGKETTIYIFSCAPGLVFDEASSQCVLPKETDSCVVSESFIKNAPRFFESGRMIDLSPFILPHRKIFGY